MTHNVNTTITLKKLSNEELSSLKVEASYLKVVLCLSQHTMARLSLEDYFQTMHQDEVL